MAAKKKRVDPIKQREKRTKIAAIVGVVLLVAVGAYEIPSMLAVMNKKPPTRSTYAPGPSSVLPNVAGGTGGAAAAPSGQLVNTDVPPQSGAGQLVSFSVFETKNPFTPQVSSAPTGSSPSGAENPAASVPSIPTLPTTYMPTTTTPAGTVVPPTGTTPATTPPTGTTATPTTPAVQPTVAISVNGVVSRVGRDGTFPTGAPVFRLVSWTKDVAQVGIVGGSYATGAATLTLHVGTPVTLQNQTDGKRYRIELLSTP